MDAVVTEATKREQGHDWPSSAFLHVPDKDTPSTWKLRIRELVNGKPQTTAAQLARAWQALTKGFRGNRVQGLSSAERTRYLARLRSLYRSIGKKPPDTKEGVERNGDGYLYEDTDAFVEATVDREEGVIRNVAVLGPLSRNGRRYLTRALSEAVPLYEGVKVFLNHPASREERERHGARDVRDLAGWITNPRFEGGKVRGDLNLIESDSRLLAIAERNPALLGLSHVAQGRATKQKGELIVEEILNVRSVDVVSDPATTSGLFEGQESTEGKTMTLSELRESHPDLVQQIAEDVKRSLETEGERKELTEKVTALEKAKADLDAKVKALEEEKVAAKTAQLLEQKLAESKLSDKVKARIRKGLEGKALTEQQIDEAVKEWQEIAAEMTEGLEPRKTRQVPITRSDRKGAKELSVAEQVIYRSIFGELPETDKED